MLEELLDIIHIYSSEYEIGKKVYKLIPSCYIKNYTISSLIEAGRYINYAIVTTAHIVFPTDELIAMPRNALTSDLQKRLESLF